MLLSPVGPSSIIPCSDEVRGCVRGWGLTNAHVRIRDGLKEVPVEERSAAVTVLALGVVLAVVTHAPTAAPARQVCSHVEVTAVRVAVTVTS